MKKNNARAKAGEMSDEAGETIGERVRKAREAKKMTQRQLAIAVGTSQQAIHNLETKDKGGSTFLVPMAEVLGVSAEYLWSGKSGDARKKGDDNNKGIRIQALPDRAPIIGSVGAGVWREHQVNLAAHTGEEIPYLPTTRHAGLPQYGLKVEGNSFNKVVRPGEYVAAVFCQDGASPIPGDIVVIEKRNAGLFELTLKRLTHQNADTIVLSPESDDNSYTPLIVNAAGDENVRIVAVAIGKYQAF